MNSIIHMAKDENSLHEMNKGIPGKWQHADGWGVAYLTEKGTFKIKKSAQAIFADPEVNKLHKIKTRLLLAHVRRKAGSEVAQENTHPFQANHASLGKCIFCHNGCIKDNIAFSPDYALKGETDSERLFYSILSDITENKDEKIAAAIQGNLQRYAQTKGSNIVLTTADKTFVAVRKNQVPKYYGMSIGEGSDFMIISSEKLKTFPDISWRSVLPGEVVIVNNGTKQFFVREEGIPLLQKIVAMIRN